MSSSISNALGISTNPNTLSNAILLSFQNLGITPQDFPRLLPQLSNSSNDLQLVYTHQTRHSEHVALDIHRIHSSRKKEYQDLLGEIKSSRNLLDSLSDFLAHFQRDLSTVSTSISDLQSRSKLIQDRLEGRRSLESKLRPYLSKTVIPPELINTIMNTEPNETWLDQIEQLEVRLVAIKIGFNNSIQAGEQMINLIEKLRLKASDKIKLFFINSLDPWRSSISSNFQVYQTNFLLKFQTLFHFLQRNSTKISHQVQKFYTSTCTWFFETSFRRYVRSLDKIRSRGFYRFGLLADLTQNLTVPTDASIVSRSKLEGENVILAHTADDSSFRQPPESLFRSLSLVVIDNALSEWSFLNHFFGQASTTLETGNLSRTTRSDTSLNPPSPSSISNTPVRKQSLANSIPDSDSFITEPHSEFNSLLEHRSQTVIDLVFKQILAPVFEYHKSFTAKLLSTNDDLPDTNSIYAMIQLNEGLITRSTKAKCASIETHLMGIKMQLWPIFQIKMNQEIQTIRINVTRGIDLKLLCLRFIYLFSTMVEMDTVTSSEDVNLSTDHDKVLNQLLVFRDSIIAGVLVHASKLSIDSRKSFLTSIYQDVQTGLTTFLSSQTRRQTEFARWKELLELSN